MTGSGQQGSNHSSRYARFVASVLVGFSALCCCLFVSTPMVVAGEFGDTDGDCDVDLDDLNNVRNHFGDISNGEPVLGDTDGNGAVDIDDFNNTRKNLFEGTLVVGPAPASGAEIRVRPVVATVGFVADPTAVANWMPDGSGGALIAPGQGEVFAFIDLLMTIDDVARPDAVGFGNVWFDVPLGGGLREGLGDISVGWLASVATANHDGNPDTPDVPVFADNFDAVMDRDLADIVAGLSPRDFGPAGVDPRRMLGQVEPFKLGSVFVTVDSDMVGVSGNVEAIVNAFSTYDQDLQLGRNDGHMAGGLITIRVPAADCPIGDTDCDGDIDLDDLNNVRNNFGATGPADGALSGDSFPFDGQVNIDDLNNVRNNFGTSAAMQPVPEPATFLLLGIALVGLAPFRWHAPKAR